MMTGRTLAVTGMAVLLGACTQGEPPPEIAVSEPPLSPRLFAGALPQAPVTPPPAEPALVAVPPPELPPLRPVVPPKVTPPPAPKPPAPSVPGRPAVVSVLYGSPDPEAELEKVRQAAMWQQASRAKLRIVPYTAVADQPDILFRRLVATVMDDLLVYGVDPDAVTLFPIQRSGGAAERVDILFDY